MSRFSTQRVEPGELPSQIRAERDRLRGEVERLETLARELENLRQAQQKETSRLVHFVVRHGSDAKTMLGHLAEYPACCTTHKGNEASNG